MCVSRCVWLRSVILSFGDLCCFLFLCGLFVFIFIESNLWARLPIQAAWTTKQWIKLLLRFVFFFAHCTLWSCVGENCFPFRRLLTDFMYQFASSIIRFFFIIYLLVLVDLMLFMFILIFVSLSLSFLPVDVIQNIGRSTNVFWSVLSRYTYISRVYLLILAFD